MPRHSWMPGPTITRPITDLLDDEDYANFQKELADRRMRPPGGLHRIFAASEIGRASCRERV